MPSNNQGGKEPGYATKNELKREVESFEGLLKPLLLLMGFVTELPSTPTSSDKVKELLNSSDSSEKP